MNYTAINEAACAAISDADLRGILASVGLANLIPMAVQIRKAVCGDTKAATVIEMVAKKQGACSCKGKAVATLSQLMTQATGGCGSTTSTVPTSQPTSVPRLEPGFDNCLTRAGDLADCDVDRIQRTKKRFNQTGDSNLGELVEVTAEVSSELDTPTGMAWFRLVVPAIGVSHNLCPNDFTLIETDNGGAPDVDITSSIGEIAVQNESIYQDANGNFVHAWEFPTPADPDDLRNTESRCYCERLCMCVHYYGDGSILVLAPPLPPGKEYVFTAKGNRTDWEIVCGSCPPGLLCGRTIIS